MHVHSQSLDERLFRQLLALRELLVQEPYLASASQELICSLTELIDHADDVEGERSPLQIKLILRSLHPSSVKKRAKASQ